jgi:excisionase family DNA binding protein
MSRAFSSSDLRLVRDRLCERVHVLAAGERLVPLSEAAQRLAVCTRTLRRLIDLGQLRVVRIGRGRGVLRVAESELARVIAEGTTQG